MEVFENSLQTGGIWKCWLFFLLDGKRFENVAFHKRWRHNNQIISLTAFSANKIQNLTVTLLNSSGVVDGRHLRRFQSKTSRIKIGRSLVTSILKLVFNFGVTTRTAWMLCTNFELRVSLAVYGNALICAIKYSHAKVYDVKLRKRF